MAKIPLTVAGAEKLRAEWVVKIDGRVRRRPEGTDNPELPTGTIEVFITEIEVLGEAAELPMPVFGDQEYPEEIRLKYRFLDLRRERLHQGAGAAPCLSERIQDGEDEVDQRRLVAGEDPVGQQVPGFDDGPFQAHA